MRSPASLMPTGRPAAAGTALTRKTGTAPNANCSVGPPPKWPTEGRRQGRRRGSLTRLRYKAPGDVESSLIQNTVDRLRPVIAPERLWVLTNDYLRDEIVRQLPEIPTPQILAEPAQRDRK